SNPDLRCRHALLPGRQPGPARTRRSVDGDNSAHAARPANRTGPVETADRADGTHHAAHRIRCRATALAKPRNYQALAMFPCCVIQVCMAIPAATAALMLRVEPNWAIDTVSAAAGRASSLMQVHSWPNIIRPPRGSAFRPHRSAPGTISTATTGRHDPAAKLSRSAVSPGW